jgi:hypothetical protein
MWVLQWRRKKLDLRQGMYLPYSDGSWIHSVTAGWYRFIYNVTIRFYILDIQLCVGWCGSEWFVICETTDNDCWLITEWIILTTDKGLTRLLKISRWLLTKNKVSLIHSNYKFLQLIPKGGFAISLAHFSALRWNWRLI